MTMNERTASGVQTTILGEIAIGFFFIATCYHLSLYVANAPESDKRDLKSELELMKTLKPHPHVIKLLGCVTESGK